MKISDNIKELSLFYQIITLFIKNQTFSDDFISLSVRPKGNIKLEHLRNFRIARCPNIYIVHLGYDKLLIGNIILKVEVCTHTKFIIIGKGAAVGHHQNKLLTTVFIYDLKLIDLETKRLTEIETEKGTNISSGVLNMNMKIVRLTKFGKDTRKLSRRRKLNWSVLYQDKIGYFNSKDRSGIEFEIFELIFQHLKIRVDYVSQQKFNITEFVPFIVIGSKVVSSKLISDFTVSYAEDYLKLYVPAPEKWPRWRYLLSVFSLELWSLWFVAFSLILLTWLLVEISLQRYKCLSEVLQNFTKTFVGILVGNMEPLQSLNAPKQILFFCVVVFMFYLSAFFGTRLSYLLNGINLEENINSPEDIVKHRLKIMVPTSYIKKISKEIEAFREYDERILLDRKFKLERRVFSKKYAWFCPAKTVAYVLRNGDGSGYLKELQESYLTVHVAAIFRRNHPYYPLINRHLRYLVESGITKKINEKYQFIFRNFDSQQSPTQKLNLSHIVAPTIILFLGLLISTIIFMFEQRIM